MTKKDFRVELALERIVKVARILLEDVYEAADEAGDDVGVDTFSLILILDQIVDSDSVEHCVIASESTRRFVQEGILRAALREHDMKMRGQEYDETDDDD